VKSLTIIRSALLGAALCAPIYAQDIAGPVLGFIPNSDKTAVFPVLGVPGASLMGAAISLEGGVSALTVSPRQDFALAVADQTHQAMLIDLSRPGFSITALALIANRPQAALSPTGAAAAVFDGDSQRLQIMGGLPKSPQSLANADVSFLGEPLRSMAVSDDGSLVLLETDTTLWTLRSSGYAWQVPIESPDRGAFLPNRRDAVITDDQTRSAYLIRDLGGANELAFLASARDSGTFTAASGSEDGRQVLLAANTGEIHIVDVATGYESRIACSCSPTGINRLRGSAVFRLTEPSTEPIAVLDASSGDSRIVLIPPSAGK